MKNLNFTNKYTERKTINYNNCAKFEVNRPRWNCIVGNHEQLYLREHFFYSFKP